MARKDTKGRNLQTGESQRKDGSYQYRWTDSFQKRHCIYAPDLNTLRMKEKEILKADLSGTNYECGNMTVQEVVEWYLKRKKNIRKGSLNNYRVISKRIENKPISHMKIANLRYCHAEDFLESLSAIDGLSFGTIARTKGFLSAVFNEALKNDFVQKNVFAGCSMDMIPRNRKEKEAINREEFTEYLSFTRSYGRNTYLADIIELLYLTGLRVGEVLALTVKDVNLKNGTISVNKQITGNSNRQAHIAEPKTRNAYRTIPLNSRELEIVTGYMKQKKKVMPCLDGFAGFLFTTPQGNPLVRQNIESFMKRVQTAWDKKHSEPMKNFSPHVLRHSYITNLVFDGVPLKTVQKAAGHSDIKITLDVYSHVTDAEATEQLKQYLV